MNPEGINKYLYVERTPTWLVRSVYFIGISTWLLVVYEYALAAFYIPFYRWVIAPFIIYFTVYQFLSFGFNLFYKRFDLKKHRLLLEHFWSGDPEEPSVDVFLPICGEDMEILLHTWESVSRLKYRNMKVYVLDDSKEDCDKHEAIAKQYGFSYFERPNKGETKKAGNLKYGYQHSDGQFIAIFDADFAPHPDFLHDLLPYMGDPRVGIVQSPQYFETTERVNKRSALEYGSAYIQECFYRFIEVVRDRFNATVCCGTCAIYRRAALDEIGGTVQVGHSEDQRTGFALQSRGWIVRYVPIILAVGLCPDNMYTYFHQQHRWCAGNVELMLDKNFWTSPVSWKTKLSYFTGFLFYLWYPLSVILSFQLFYSLFVYNRYISLAAAIPFFPYLLFAVIFAVCFATPRYRWGAIYASFARVYGYSHAIVSTLFGSSVAWISSGAKHAGISRAFRQATLALGVYVIVNAILVAIAVREGLLHLFNYNYYSVQLWLFYNLTLSGVLLWQMYRSMERVRELEVTNGTLPRSSYTAWQLKTAGLYVFLLTGVFLGIVYL